MSFILRLQNLPWSANAMDIRNFFKGLGIPDGGVHIVGGEIGDAFIAFSNDEDARQAMLRDGGKIKEVQVRLLLSSRTEMQKVIDTARLSSNQYGTLGKSSTAIVAPTVHIVAPTQIQPPVITSNLTGLVSKQMEVLQSHTAGTTLSAQTLIQLKQQQTKLNALLMSNVNDASNEIKNDDRSSSEIDRKRDSDRRDRAYRSPRSRSRDRSKRSRTRSRSRDRLGRTRRRRSRSRERRNRPRRSSSRERSRSRERNSRDTKKELPNPWAINPNPATSILVQNDAIKVQNIDDLRNPIAFQGNTGLLLPDNAPLFTTSSSLNKPLIVTNNFITSSYDQKSQIDKTDGRCVKISKMDRITGYGEIRRFFAGLQIHQNGIKMINDKTGRRTGVAYIRFARLEFKRTALLQSGLTLRDAKVEVSPLLDEDFDEAVDSFKPRYESYRRGGSYRSDDDDDDRDSDDDYYRKDRDRSRSRERERERSRSDRNRFKSRNDSDDDDLQIISNTSRDNNTDNDEDDVKLVSDSTKDSFTTLLIKDIPPFTKEQDIIKMFSNYTLVHILICKNVDGTKANYAYAKFHRAEDAKSALKEKACHLIAYRNVTVSRVSDDIYDKDKNEINSDINLLDSELQSSTAKQQTNIMMSNNIVKEEEKHEKTDTNTESNKVKMPLDPRLQKSQSSQNSYLMNQFDNSCNNVWGTTATQTTSSVWQMNNIGSGGISLMNNGNSNDSNVYQPRKDPRLSRFDSPKPALTASVQPWSNLGDLSSMNNFTNILSNNDNNVPLIRDPRQRNTGTTLYNNAPSTSMEENTYMPSVQNYALQSNVIHSVVMSNLEPNISDRDVTDFFSEVGLIPQRVRFLSNRNGMPTGDCFCEFSTSEEARRALQKNNYHLGMNSIKIELIASDKMEDILASFNNDSSMDMRNDPRNSNYNNNNSNSSNSNNSNNYRDRERGGNDNFRDRMNNNSNNSNNMNNYRGNGNFRGGNNNNNSNAGRGFRGNNSMNRMNNNSGTNKMNPFNNNTGNNNNSNSKPPSLLSLPTPPLGISVPGPFNNNGPLTNNNQEFDKIGCVVSMENVPYRAGVDDILDFFNGFILDKQNIMRRYNDNGTPTGDARVCFLSPAEAKRAMEIKKYGKIFNRTIYLKLLDEM